MTPEQRRLWIISGAHQAQKKDCREKKGESFDVLGFAFIGALVVIILFVWIAGFNA